MTAQQWHYTPDTITVKKGIPVKLTITSIDVTHGFQLSSGGIDASTTESPGSPGVVEFTPMQTGSFVFRCSVFCGTGHGGMSGTLIVTD
jgi:cytochrome c oxidase subunit 2